MTHGNYVTATSRSFPGKHPNLPEVRILYKIESLPIKISISYTACTVYRL